MKIRGIATVTLAADHIHVKKDDSDDQITWHALKPIIIATLIDFFTSDLPAYTDSCSKRPHHHNAHGECVESSSVSETDIVIEDLINTKLRPFVQDEGGDVVFKKFNSNGGTVYVELFGTCLSSPKASTAIMRVVFTLLKFYVPAVLHVKQVERMTIGKSRSSYF